MFVRVALRLLLCLPLSLMACSRVPSQPAPATDTARPQTARTRPAPPEDDPLREVNNQIRRELFDAVLPEVMRKNKVDMWIHVMRETIPDPFGAEDLAAPPGCSP